MIKQYRKAPPKHILPAGKTGFQKHLKILAISLLVGGGIMVVSVIAPILSYEVFLAPQLKDSTFLTPLSAQGLEKDESKGTASTEISHPQTQELIHPQNWFPKMEYSNDHQSNITHYTLSIPKLNIKDAVVEIGGEDLSKSLIHYPKTALPGDLGATIIFGHSILPQFFNPKNYMSIFSLLPTLELGDDIIIKYDGITFTYRVIDKVEVKPTNLVVLEQPYDNEYLRLITCTPPGTYLRRGVITATLID